MTSFDDKLKAKLRKLSAKGVFGTWIFTTPGVEVYDQATNIVTVEDPEDHEVQGLAPYEIEERMVGNDGVKAGDVQTLFLVEGVPFTVEVGMKANFNGGPHGVERYIVVKPRPIYGAEEVVAWNPVLTK